MSSLATAGAHEHLLPELDGWRIDLAPPPPAVAAPVEPGVEVDRLAEAARRGHEEGLAAGRAVAEAELAPLRASLGAAAAALTAARDQVCSHAEARAVELAVTLAEKILGVAVEVDPTHLFGVVEGALRRLADKDDIVLEVSLADVEPLRAEIDRIALAVGGAGKVSVVGDRRVGRGGCIVRTLDGEIDARLEVQLERADELLRRSLSVTR